MAGYCRALCLSHFLPLLQQVIADRVLQLADNRMTPAERYNDGLDYVPTNKYVLFGHHFAAIGTSGRAGAGGADGLSPRHAMDPGRRGVRRRGSGFRDPVLLAAIHASASSPSREWIWPGWTQVAAAAGCSRGNFLLAIGAPDYGAYLAHHAARHPGSPPLSEREYVKLFIEHRYNRRGAGRCCSPPAVSPADPWCNPSALCRHASAAAWRRGACARW